MESLIKKTYVINLKNRKDKWENIKNDFKNTGLKLNRWEAIYGNNLSDDKIEQVTSNVCNYLCSPNIIGRWLSHYKLWEHVVKNEEDRVLILEDDAYPAKNFKKKLIKFWDHIPADWDVVFLGCYGTCRVDTEAETFYKITYGRDNKNIDKHVIKPGFPTGFHGYIISYEGAKKLINHPLFKKINESIDTHFAKHIVTDPDFNVYAFVPQLVYRYDNNNRKVIETHKIGNPFGKHNLVHYRPLGVDISYFSIFLFVSALLVGIFGNNNLKNNYFLVMIVLQLFELAYTRTDYTKFKTIILELLLVYTFFTIGMKARKYIYKQ